MYGVNWQTSPRQYQITKQLNVRIPVSDGITLDADIHRPSTGDRLPALLSVHPYNKRLQFDAMMPTGLNMANGGIEAGDSRFFARRGYAHVVANNRGTGASGGCYTNYGPREVRDTYEAIEWVARQPWCDGNVGMFGVSAFAVSQQQVAALKPPHLKAIFTPFGYTDFYRDKFYHGGILSHAFMRGWTTTIDNFRYQSWALERWGKEKYEAAIAEALADDEITAVPYLAQALRHPEAGTHALLVDILVNRLNTEYFAERSVDYAGPDVPAYLGGDWGMYGLHLPGAFRSWANWKGPKKLILGPPCYLDRPVYQYAYESLRWFDYWLKGIDNGIMDEPLVNVFLMGTGEWRSADDWPMPQTKWTPFYLHEKGLLSEHEFWPNEGATTFEDSFMHREGLTFTTPKLLEDTEVIGHIAMKLYASTTDTEILWFVSVYDIGPDDESKLITRGWLRGSQHATDALLSKPWLPYHTHTARQPLTPDEIYEFDIEVRPMAQMFRAGHRIAIKIRCCDDEKPTCFPDLVGAGHLWRQVGSRITIHHNEDHPSHLLLPVTKGNIIGTYMSGGKTSAEFFPYRTY
jgi:predicted acyl esterase